MKPTEKFFLIVMEHRTTIRRLKVYSDIIKNGQERPEQCKQLVMVANALGAKIDEYIDKFGTACIESAGNGAIEDIYKELNLKKI